MSNKRDSNIDSSTSEATQQVGTVFTQLFDSLHSLCPEGDIFIGRFSMLERTCRIDFASGIFTRLLKQTLDVRRGPFEDLLTGRLPEKVITGETLRRTAVGFTGIGTGKMAAFRVNLAGDEGAMVGYWLPRQQGQLTEDRIEALRSVIELASAAASVADMALDMEAQKLHLDRLHDEIEQIQIFYRQFSDTIRQTFWVLDVDTGKPLLVSDNFQRVWGAPSTMLHNGLTGFMGNVFPGDRDRVLAEFYLYLGAESLSRTKVPHLNAAFETDLTSAFDCEFRLVDEAGELRWIWLRAFPAGDTFQQTTPASGRDSGRKPASTRKLVMIADDVTERKSSDESVRAREGEIASRSRMVAVGELASAISQAIDSPLSTLEERAAAVLTRLNSSAPASEDHALSSVRTDLRAFAEEVRDISQKLSSLTANLLSLTPQTEPVEYKQIKVARVLASVKSICDQRFQNAGVDLRFADLSKELSVEANFAQIERILLNLLENAFDAVQNVRERWVKIEITEDEDSIYFYVSDSGPGIPIKNRSRIFDPFFTTKTLETGSGLGLTLAATLASQHNGLLRFDALHPHTRFVLQLPKRHTATQSRSLAS